MQAAPGALLVSEDGVGMVHPRACPGRVCVGALEEEPLCEGRWALSWDVLNLGRVGLPLGRCGRELLVRETGQNWKPLCGK